MSPYDGSDRSGRRNRGALGPWMPLIATVAVATVGLAAWVWSEREDDDDEDRRRKRRRDRDERGDRNVGHGDRSYPGPTPSYATDVRPGEQGYGTTSRSAPNDDSYNWGARMSGALKRTPSPQQFLEGATRTVSAGISAAGQAVGNALSSIREEDKNAYRDHQTWSEEAEKRKASGPVMPATAKSVAKAAASSGKKLKVAVVVSADADLDGVDDGLDYSQTHASILSHLPQYRESAGIELYVLIFSPDLKRHPLDVVVAGQESKPILDDATPAFNALWGEAEAVVAKNTMIFPFTTQGGHVHILRHLSPDLIYLQRAMSGNEGDVITHVQNWFKGDIVVVVGGDHGDGGLADSESEAENIAHTKPKPEQWWEREDRVGKGRKVYVLDHLHVGDDWSRRVEKKD